MVTFDKTYAISNNGSTSGTSSSGGGLTILRGDVAYDGYEFPKREWVY